MSPFEVVAILLAGVAAGTINTIVGSGTLITFPTLLAFGVPPVTANVSNTVGLVPGSLSGVFGYRAELAGQRGRLVRLAGVPEPLRLERQTPLQPLSRLPSPLIAQALQRARPAQQAQQE